MAALSLPSRQSNSVMTAAACIWVRFFEVHVAGAGLELFLFCCVQGQDDPTKNGTVTWHVARLDVVDAGHGAAGLFRELRDRETESEPARPDCHIWGELFIKNKHLATIKRVLPTAELRARNPGGRPSRRMLAERAQRDGGGRVPEPWYPTVLGAIGVVTPGGSVDLEALAAFDGTHDWGARHWGGSLPDAVLASLTPDDLALRLPRDAQRNVSPDAWRFATRRHLQEAERHQSRLQELKYLERLYTRTGLKPLSELEAKARLAVVREIRQQEVRHAELAERIGELREILGNTRAETVFLDELIEAHTTLGQQTERTKETRLKPGSTVRVAIGRDEQRNAADLAAASAPSQSRADSLTRTGPRVSTFGWCVCCGILFRDLNRGKSWSPASVVVGDFTKRGTDWYSRVTRETVDDRSRVAKELTAALHDSPGDGLSHRGPFSRYLVGGQPRLCAACRRSELTPGRCAFEPCGKWFSKRSTAVYCTSACRKAAGRERLADG